MKFLALALSLISTTAFAVQPQWGPYSNNPFAAINITAGSSFTVNSLNSLFTTVGWNSSTNIAKSLSIPGCSSSYTGVALRIIDIYGTASAYNITITPTSGTIIGSASTSLTISNTSKEFICDGISNWQASTQVFVPLSTVANLPTCANTLYYVRYIATDLNAPSYGASPAGGGGKAGTVICQPDGSGWAVN